MLLLTVLQMAMKMMTTIMLVCRRVIYLFGCASGIAVAATELRGVQAGPIKIILRWKEMEPNERPPNENGKQMNVF